MPSKGKKGKGKGKKEKKKCRKFNLDLFGILTLTRVHGEPFEGFMMSGDDKKGKGKKKPPPKKKGKKGKGGKKGKAEAAPALAKFDPVPEDKIKDAKAIRKRMKEKDPPDVILPMTSVGGKDKTTRPKRPFEEGGSISDVMCGRAYPLPPRPLPHGGVYGDPKCYGCKSKGGLMKSTYTKLNKKLRKMLFKEFDKAKFIIEWLTGRITNSLEKYEEHFKKTLEEFGGLLDKMDEAEWDDHFEVRALVEKWRDMQRQLDELRAELKQFRKNKDEEIDKALAEKIKEFEEVERQLLALEQKIRDAAESLRMWQCCADEVIADAERRIQETLDLLAAIRQSIFDEREALRTLLSWEMGVAVEDTLLVMEEVIKADLDEILQWMHPAWFRMFLENRKMQEERTRLRMENHLLELETATLGRQVEGMENAEKEVEASRTYFITPPTLNERVDRFFRPATPGHIPTANNFLLLQDFPSTKLIHE